MTASEHIPSKPRNIGYARVSTADQNTRLQRDALKKAGCTKIFVDEDASGKDRKRPALKKALSAVRHGDTLVVWKLDRLARSLQDLMDITKELNAAGVHLESLTEKLDTTSAYGEFTFHMIAAIAQMERRLIVERTNAGLCAAKRRGVKLGRPLALSGEQIAHAYEEYAVCGIPLAKVAEELGVSRQTLDRAFVRSRLR